MLSAEIVKHFGSLAQAGDAYADVGRIAERFHTRGSAASRSRTPGVEVRSAANRSPSCLQR